MPGYGYPSGPGATAGPMVFGSLFLLLLIADVIWELVWKGWAMWHAARRGQKGWYVAILILNTIGILPIIYLFAVAKVQKKSDVQEAPSAGQQP